MPHVGGTPNLGVAITILSMPYSSLGKTIDASGNDPLVLKGDNEKFMRNILGLDKGDNMVSTYASSEGSLFELFEHPRARVVC